MILEIDGREFHKSDEQVENDYDRQVLLVDAGWTVLRLTVRQIRSDPAGPSDAFAASSTACVRNSRNRPAEPFLTANPARRVENGALGGTWAAPGPQPSPTPPTEPSPTAKPARTVENGALGGNLSATVRAPGGYSGMISDGVPLFRVSPRKNAGALSRQMNISTTPARISPRPSTNTTPRPKMLTPVPS